MALDARGFIDYSAKHRGNATLRSLALLRGVVKTGKWGVVDSLGIVDVVIPRGWDKKRYVLVKKNHIKSSVVQFGSSAQRLPDRTAALIVFQ